MLKKLLFIFCILFIFNASNSWSEPHNIIILIGDGMGFEHVKATGIYSNGTEGTLNFESFPNQAEMTTYSADSSVTDSAASATAIATATKVYNGVISTALPGDSSELETLLEHFSAQGKSTGLVTSTAITHATPAAFGAHESSRNNENEIALDYLTQTRPNVLFGGGGNGISVSSALGADYTVVTDRVEMQGLNTDIETMVSGQFGTGDMPYEIDYFNGTDNSYDVLPHLSEMTETALDILDNDPDGFFLMVEGGRIDHASHANKLEKFIFETIEFTNTIQEVMDWAQGRSDTLVLVVADHETGGLTVTQNNGQGNVPDVTWTTVGHTGVNVPVYAWGVNANLVSGVIDNTDIHDIAISSIPDISLSPVSVNYGDITEGSNSTPQIITISNTGSADLNVSDIQLSGFDQGEFILDINAGADPCGSTSPVISSGSNCTITVTFSPTSEGIKSADLEIDSDDSDESTVIVSLSGTGTTQLTPDIDVTDSILPDDDHQMDFGEITELQSSAPATVTISNTGTSDLSVYDIQLTGLDQGEFVLDVSGGTVPCGSTSPVIFAGSNCTVTVTFSPTSEGTNSANLDITSNDSNESTVNVTLSGTGLILFTPEINVTDSILPDNDLQVQFVDTKTFVSSDPETVTISNTGTADLSVSGIQLAGADPAEFDLEVNGGAIQCGSTSPVISAGSNCTVTITFSPTSEGAKSANLDISSNDSNESTVTVALSGTGVDNNPPTPAQLVYPTDGLTNLGTTIDFSWNKSTDPDPGDTVSYEVMICTDQNFTQGCISETVTASLVNKGVYFAGFGYGLVLFGIVLLGSERGRKNLVLLLVVVMLSSTLLVACGSSGDDQPSPPSSDITHQVTGLNFGTNFYWKVVADDGNGGTSDSVIRSFATQQ